MLPQAKFYYLCLLNGVGTPEKLTELSQKFQETLDFAQAVVDNGLTTDFDKVEQWLNWAVDPNFSIDPVELKRAGINLGTREPITTGVKLEKLTGLTPAQVEAHLKSLINWDALPTNQSDVQDLMENFLITCSQLGVSDVHFSTGAAPFIRYQRANMRLSTRSLTKEEAFRLNTALLAKTQRDTFVDRKDFDCALSLGNVRYRVNLIDHKYGSAGAFRVIKPEVPHLEDLGFKDLAPIKKMLSYHNGLIMVTGPIGAGKTTTLASMVQYLNETRQDHIITVEDPIEYVMPAKGCNVTQREVGPHTNSFFTALKGALREDPDVIVIGELRDLETIEMAISASETGHLVIGTMHTSDASTTLNRLLDAFPPAQQTQIRASVSESLRGILCQRLLPSRAGGLVMAYELLVNNTAVCNLIRENKMQGLRNVMETGVREGMCLMENYVLQLWKEQKIDEFVALQNTITKGVRQQIKKV